MNETFEKLRPEYESLLSSMRITRGQDALAVAAVLLKTCAAYTDASVKTGVPLAWLMAVNERESGGRLDTYLGDGEPLNRITRNVPRGRGPFPTWTVGAVDALDYDHVAGIEDWSWARACFEGELWNGFGYRMHGRHSAYLWAGTSVYQGGKFMADGVWNPHENDAQLGIVPLMCALIKLDPSLQFPGGFPNGAVMPPLAAPAELAGGLHGVNWVQDVLNHVMDAGLTVDGSFGRKTRTALKAFQGTAGLAVDGLAGPQTTAALEKALSEEKAPAVASTNTAEASRLVAEYVTKAGGEQAFLPKQEAPQSVEYAHADEFKRYAGYDHLAVDLHKDYEPPAAPQPVVNGIPQGLFSGYMQPKPMTVTAGFLPVYPIYDHDCALLCERLYNYNNDPSIFWDYSDEGADDGVCWAVKRIGDVDVIVMRGSTTLEDWVDDVEAVASSLPDEPVLGRVHQGFSFGLGQVAREILARDPKHLLITGHSLGAARASILTGILKNGGKPPLARVIFGEPRPGYIGLANYLADIPVRSYRNGRGIRGDLITGLPFSTGFLPWVNSAPFIEVNAPPRENDPWGPFSWHHVQLYAQALSTINTGTAP